MRCLKSLALYLTVCALVLALTPARAQPEARPPQFLYRDGERLMLVTVEGDTAETQVELFANLVQTNKPKSLPIRGG